jgi:hypothetical protein
MPPSGYEEFQNQYENESDREFESLSKLPVHALLDRVRASQFGGQHQIWRAIRDKASLEESAGTLLAVLESNAEYLSRYHCADALLKIAGKPLKGWEAVHLSGGPGWKSAENVKTIRAWIEATLGRRV